MSETDPRADDPNDRPHPAGAPDAPPVIEHHPEPRERLGAPEPMAAAPPPPPKTQVVRRGGTPFIVTLLLVGATAGAGYYGWTHPAPPELMAGDAQQGGQAGSTDQLKADLQGQIQASQQSATQAATQVATQAAAAAVGQAVGPLHDQIAALADRVDKLEKAPPPAAETPAPATPAGPAPASADEVTALKQTVDQLSTKIDALQTAASAAPAPAPPPPPAPAPTPDPAAMSAATSAQAQVAALSSKIDQLEQAQKAALAQAADEQKAALAQREALAQTQEQQKSAVAQQIEQQVQQQAGQQKAAIEQQAEQQKAALAQTVDQQKAVIDALTARLGKLEQGTGKIESEADMAARAAKAESLQASLAAGKPLGKIPDAPPALARFETTAPPTEDALRAAFPQVAEQARAASRPEEAEHSFWSRALARMQRTVVVRQGDRVIVGDPAAGVLARATDDVNRGDLPAAVQALSALQGPAAQAVAGWVAQVRSLLEARAALSAMAVVPPAVVH